MSFSSCLFLSSSSYVAPLFGSDLTGRTPQRLGMTQSHRLPCAVTLRRDAGALGSTASFGLAWGGPNPRGALAGPAGVHAWNQFCHHHPLRRLLVAYPVCRAMTKIWTAISARRRVLRPISLGTLSQPFCQLKQVSGPRTCKLEVFFALQGRNPRSYEGPLTGHGGVAILG